MPTNSASPTTVIVITFDRAGEQEQDGGTLGNPGRPCPALDQQPRTDRDAPGASKRDGGPERELAERDATAEPDRRCLEHLQEGEHIRETGEDLERDRSSDPAELHVRQRVPHTVQPRYCEDHAERPARRGSPAR
jgi:hypothetical protein